MLRIKPGDLRAGMIVAEAIVDVTGTVLLEAKAQLTQANIDLLRTWEIDFIRIREAGDTDQSVAREIMLENKGKTETMPAGLNLDQEIERKIGISEQGIIMILRGDIFGQAADWRPARPDTAGMGSLATREGIKYYQQFLSIIAKLLDVAAREKEFSIKEVNEVARVVTDYVIKTPGVIGYALRPEAGGCSPLARHTLSVAVVAGKLGMLRGYSAKEVGSIVLASLLHDIGKLGLPPHIANRSGRLAVAEEKLYQSHVSLSLGRIKGRTWIPKEVLLAVAQHHERMDGKGFPMGFSGEKIHPYARIIAIADYFDEAVCSLKGDATGLSDFIKGLPYLSSRFDPGLCEVFANYLKDFLLSNTLELEDGRTAQIVFTHYSFAEPVIRTDDGHVIDLNKRRDIRIEKYSI